MLIYSLDPASRFAPALAAALDEQPACHEDRSFEDGEHKWRPLTDPRGQDAYVVDSLHGGPVDSPHDKLCRLLMFIATLRDHGAARVTAVLPYLAYARKDRRTQPFDPLGLRYVAQLLEAVGTAQLIVLEPHNGAALENACRCPVWTLPAHAVFGAAIDGLLGDAAAGALVVASPDPGGVKRAQLWREDLERRRQRPVGFAMVDKRRSGGVLSSLQLVAGDVAGATVLLLDDLVASGRTLQGAAVALRQAGARSVFAFAAHGLFVAPAADVLADPAIDGIVVSDSVPAFRLPAQGAVAAKLRVVSAVPLLARAVRESHDAWSP